MMSSTTMVVRKESAFGLVAGTRLLHACMQYLSAYHTEKSRRMGKSQAFVPCHAMLGRSATCLQMGWPMARMPLGIESSIRLEGSVYHMTAAVLCSEGFSSRKV